ncbi:MAG: FAD:protein FMN transferase [Candidatus Gracilibacteria bacterium]|nr:FAD:protein FMN transferase [Candidatus Gracilibacteria bacterium]
MKYEKTNFLMGTDITITVISVNNSLQDIYDGFAIFYSLEKEFSRFSETSDLSILNHKKNLEVSDRFIDILNKSYEIYKLSNTYFNPLVSVKNIGYSHNFALSIFEKICENVNLDFDKVAIIGNFVTLKENQNLDLGGIVKGYGVDLVSTFLKSRGYTDFIVNAGGDIYLYGNNTSGKIPVVGIDSPFNKTDIFATLEVKNSSVSTSGIYKRKWELDGKNYNHILNPETNTNNSEIISITLISPKCYITDAYATACIAMGIKKSLIFLEKENIDALIIGSDGNIYQTKNMVNFNLKII